MKTKEFDCVEMKRRGSLRVYEQLKNMTVEEQIAFWRERNQRFRRDQEEPGKKKEKVEANLRGEES